MTDDYFKYIPNNLSVKDLPFSDIFRGNYRIAIPLQSQESDKIIKKLKDLGYTNIDIVNNKVTEPKYNRVMNLGKIIRKELGEEAKKQYDKIKVQKESEDIYIIISRSPIDIARMSDFSNISSCHSTGKQFWYCAFEEAISGGAIAYAVDRKSIESISDLQSPEIFSDKDRGIDGINPISRIRLNRYHNTKEGYDMLLPVPKQYGEKLNGFIESVTQWSRKSQSDLFNKSIDINDFVIHGGSYKDIIKGRENNIDGTIFNNFFETDSYSGNVEHKKTNTERETEFYGNIVNNPKKIEEIRKIDNYLEKNKSLYRDLKIENINDDHMIGVSVTINRNLEISKTIHSIDEFYNIMTDEGIKKLIYENIPFWSHEMLDRYNLEYINNNWARIMMKFKFQSFLDSDQVIYGLSNFNEIKESIYEIGKELKDILEIESEQININANSFNWYKTVKNF